MLLPTPRLFIIFMNIVLSNQFIINTPGCKIKDFNITFNDKPSYIICGTRHVFIQKISNNKIRFHIDKQLDFCCYSYIYRSKNRYVEDDALEYSPCLAFKNQTVVDLESDRIVVKCGNPGASGSYDDYYGVIKKIQRTSTKTKDSYNVLLLGIDAMSRKRFYNSMKETVAFLKNNDWLDFRGYNKVGGNTKPNFMAMLTGRYVTGGPTSFIYECYLRMSACNDLMLWSQYKDDGYITAFAEESTFYSSVLSDIILVSPALVTDHYLRPLFKAGKRNSDTICTGQISSGEQILNNALDFAKTYKRDKFFGVFWTASHSHDVWQSPVSFDKIVTKFFKNLERSGVLDNTFVILLSDHGIRFGPVRYQIQAFYDERLPMIFMHVPEKFKSNHSDKYANLKFNQHRLFSPFDLHLTLKDLLDVNGERNVAVGCKTCLSLFRRLPRKRRCADAGIDDKWCTCFSLEEITVIDQGANRSVAKAATYVKELPTKIMTKPNTRCRDLFPIKILRMHYFLSNPDTKYYIVAFIVNPTEVYELLVKEVSEKHKSKYDIVISQAIEDYGNKGYCVISIVNASDAYGCVCMEA